MGKYGEALGVWELRVGGFTRDLIPKKGDNLKLSRLMSESKKRNDNSWMMEQMGEFVKELIIRDHPPLNDAEKEELDIYIEFNVMDLIKELLIAFRWTTREKWDSSEKEALKKIMPQVAKEN